MERATHVAMGRIHATQPKMNRSLVGGRGVDLCKNVGGSKLHSLLVK